MRFFSNTFITFQTSYLVSMTLCSYISTHTSYIFLLILWTTVFADDPMKCLTTSIENVTIGQNSSICSDFQDPSSILDKRIPSGKIKVGSDSRLYLRFLSYITFLDLLSVGSGAIANLKDVFLSTNGSLKEYSTAAQGQFIEFGNNSTTNIDRSSIISRHFHVESFSTVDIRDTAYFGSLYVYKGAELVIHNSRIGFQGKGLSDRDYIEIGKNASVTLRDSQINAKIIKLEANADLEMTSVNLKNPVFRLLLNKAASLYIIKAAGLTHKNVDFEAISSFKMAESSTIEFVVDGNLEWLRSTLTNVETKGKIHCKVYTSGIDVSQSNLVLSSETDDKGVCCKFDQQQLQACKRDTHIPSSPTHIPSSPAHIPSSPTPASSDVDQTCPPPPKAAAVEELSSRDYVLMSACGVLFIIAAVTSSHIAYLKCFATRGSSDHSSGSRDSSQSPAVEAKQTRPKSAASKQGIAVRERDGTQSDDSAGEGVQYEQK